MNKALSFVSEHPFLTFFIFSVLVSTLKAILKWILKGNKEPSDSGSGFFRRLEAEDEKQEEDKTEETIIKILTSTGTLVEEFRVKTDSIEYDSSDGVYIEFDDNDGKRITYVLGTFSVKMTDL